MLQITVRWSWLVVLFISFAPKLSADETTDALKVIQSVSSEGKGNRQAVAAWKKLAAGGAPSIPALLVSLDDANPLAANYVRSAIEAIADREISQGAKLPAGEIEKFVKETKHSPRGRRLAFDLLARVDRSAPDRLIPGMLNDPSVELRRDAVQRLIVQGNEQLASEKKEEARSTFSTALGGARDDDQVQAIRKKLEELGVTVDLPKHFGFMMSWNLIAPFDNTEKKGMAAVYPPEERIDLGAEYEGKGGMKVRWTPHTTDNEYGMVDLAKGLSPYKGAVCYATTEFISDKGQPVEFRLGTPNAWKVWLNGQLLFSREEYHRGTRLDQYKMRGMLQPGRNVILLKVCQNEQTEKWAQDWKFQFRVCDEAGTAVLSADRPAAPAAQASANAGATK